MPIFGIVFYEALKVFRSQIIFKNSFYQLILGRVKSALIIFDNFIMNVFLMVIPITKYFYNKFNCVN